MPAFSPGEIHDAFQCAFNAGDLEAVIALYEPDAIFISGGRRIEGTSNIAEAYRAILASGLRMQLVTTKVIECGALALLHGKWSHGASGGMSTEVVRRQSDGTWKFVIDNPHTPG